MGEAHQIYSGQPCMDRIGKRIEHEKGSLKWKKQKKKRELLSVCFTPCREGLKTSFPNHATGLSCLIGIDSLL